MPDQPISDLFCSSRYFPATDVKASLMSTRIILLSSSCSDPRAQPSGGWTDIKSHAWRTWCSTQNSYITPTDWKNIMYLLFPLMLMENLLRESWKFALGGTHSMELHQKISACHMEHASVLRTFSLTGLPVTDWTQNPQMVSHCLQLCLKFRLNKFTIKWRNSLLDKKKPPQMLLPVH